MNCQVHQLRKTANGLTIAHVQVGPFFGDVPADESVKGSGPAFLKTKLVASKGRIEARLKVHATA